MASPSTGPPSVPSVGAVFGDLYGGVPVRDCDVAWAWYERFFGREPTYRVHQTEVIWELAPHRSLYVVQDVERAGRSLFTVFVDDLDAALADIAARGIEPAEIHDYGNGVRKADFVDPDGNTIGLGSMGSS